MKDDGNYQYHQFLKRSTSRSTASSLNVSVSVEISACFTRVSVGNSGGAAIWGTSAQDAHSADGIIISVAQNIIAFVGTRAVIDGWRSATRFSSDRACDKNEEYGENQFGHEMT